MLNISAAVAGIGDPGGRSGAAQGPESPTRLQLLPNRGRFLALAGAEVVQLRAASAAFLLHFNLRDARRMDRKHAFNPFAVGNPADGERLVQTAAFPTDDYAGKNLDSFLIALDHTGMHTHAVANLKL